MKDFQIQMGIRKPETAQETNDQLGSIDGMRRAIHRASFDSALIRQAMIYADNGGLSGEDRYVMLAYHALRQLQDVWEQWEQMAALMPNPPLIMRGRDTKFTL